jgi:hypothetical protein
MVGPFKLMPKLVLFPLEISGSAETFKQKPGLLGNLVSRDQTYLKWTEMGRMFEVVSISCGFPEKTKMFQVPVENVFWSLSTSVLPRFNDQANQLLTTLEYKLQIVTEMKQRATAGMVTCAVVISTFLKDWVLQEAKEAGYLSFMPKKTDA